ncbi:GD13672 [Drosophila simulans]|uniref:adenylate cyclase n=1 Tax=Drosophila simulans TaxID=7240 RepID=B4QN43_DROSI|nr:GD13672 [Drosophila simulans]
MDPAYSENVVDYRSLGNMPGYEWKLLRYKCRELRLEGVYHRHCHLVSVAVVTQLIIVIEILMLIHVILLFSVVKDIDFLNVLPYFAVMLLTPSILMPSREPNAEKYEAIAILVSCLMALLLTAMAFVENGRSYFLGLAVSLFYFGYMVLIDKISTLDKVWELTAYGAYLFFLNMLCMFLSRFQEYNMRSGILSRYQVVYQNLVFQLAMKEEKALLDSIIPVTLARSLQDAIASHIEEDPSNLIPFTKTRHLFMEPHPEVSILEADMVDFTSLTTTMEVSELVAILHELFVSFDLAANHNRATRIKFLGDSYTCVTGIPSYFPTHANACVNQALDMIEISREVSKRRNKKIDLRIGVHSGEILAGIIGLTKWQFDIWSKDVDITNRLESSGLPGMVHISSRTLGLLDNHYVFEKGTDTAKLDPLLQRSNLSTYLIRSRLPNFEDADDLEDDNFPLNDYRFSFSFSEDYEDIQVKAQRDMILEVEHMPVNRVQACKIRRPMHRIAKEDINEEYRFHLESYYLFTTFRSWKMEWSFSKMRDLLMKYSLGMMVFAGATIIAMDLLVKSEAMDYTMLLGLFLIILLPLLLASYKKLWLRGRRLSPITQPTFFLSRWIIKASDLIEKSVFVRIPLAIMVLFLLYVMSSETVGVTYAVIIVLSLMLVIIGIPLIIKLGVGLAILGCHVITVHAYYGFAFERSQTTDIGVSSSLAHSWYLLAFFILVVVREGYLNYILKASYFMSMCFEKKHELTKVKTRTIKIIMANILPTHVAEVFKVRRRSDQLYYENFSQVAVMFATIENYEADKLGLRALHEMICYFDELLVNYQAWYKIEKIKVMGWTYLAACGLDVDHYTDFSVSVPVSTKRESDKLQKSGSVRFAPKDDDEIMIKDLHPTQATTNEDDNTVLVMTEFALNLLRIMRDIRSKGIFFEKDSKLTGSLKIGIAHGPAMAGVVGLSKPHYDIWGHTVNMASRMTSTGVMDGIHVTESTANVLRDFNIRCTYRGMTFVKGVGQVPTYLVDLDENLHFQQHSPDNDSHKGSKVSVHWLDEKRTER